MRFQAQVDELGMFRIVIVGFCFDSGSGRCSISTLSPSFLPADCTILAKSSTENCSVNWL